MEADVRIMHKFPRLLKMVTGTGDLIDYRSIIDEFMAYKPDRDELF